MDDADATGASDPRFQIDRTKRAARYFQNAIERHWDPATVDLAADREALVDVEEVYLTGLRRALAKFGAGEQAVTEDLAPLAVVLQDTEDQLFVTTQLYEEAKHTDFFDRYWREVVVPVEETRGLEPTSPFDARWFDSDYEELFERNEAAMARLLTDDTPANRARAYCHYHLVIEGILAQTGYFGLTTAWDGRQEATPELPGLIEGLGRIRSDEGRHVGFGMAKLKDLVEGGAVEPELLSETVNGLVGLVQGTLVVEEDPDVEPIVDQEELTGYAVRKHTERMRQITDAAADIPDVDQLTRIEGD